MSGGSTLVLVDDALMEAGGPPRWLAPELPPRARVVAVRGDWTVDDVVATGAAHADAPEVWAIGGGRTVDAAKLAATATAPELAGLLRRPGRGGLVRLPGAAPRPRLVAVPSTLGTGSERSRVACLLDEHADRRRLVIGPGLRPDAARHDPRATAGLPLGLQRHAAVEVLLRVLGPVVGDRPGGPAAGAHVRADAATVARLAERLTRGPLRAQERATLAAISARTHEPAYHAGRHPFGHRAWYLANELSSVTGLAKIPATAAVLVAVWRRVEAGDARWGRADALRAAWAGLRAVVPGLAASAGAGLPTLLERWGARAAVPPVDVDALVRRTARAWGGGLPPLAGLDAAALRGVLAEAVGGAR